jgi:hypothetical protein
MEQNFRKHPCKQQDPKLHTMAKCAKTNGITSIVTIRRLLIIINILNTTPIRK